MKEQPHVLLPEVCHYLTQLWHSVTPSSRLMAVLSPLLVIAFSGISSVDWQQKLFEAARDGNIMKAKTAMLFWADPTVVDSFDGISWSPRTHAIYNKRAEIIRYFGRKGVNMNYDFGENANRRLHSSAYVVNTNDTATVNAFVEAGGHLSICTSDGQNAITYSITQNKPVATKAIATHLNINMPDKIGKLPFSYVADMKDTVARNTWYDYLSELGADPEAKDRGGNTAFHQMAKKAGTTTLGLLSTGGLIWLVSKSSKGIDLANYDGETPLMFSAKIGNDKAMSALTKKGASLIKRNKAGKNVFDVLDDRGDTKLFNKYAKKLKKQNPQAFRKVQKRFPHRIGPNGKVLKKPLPKRSLKRPHAGKYKRRKKKRKNKLLRRRGPFGLFFSLF